MSLLARLVSFVFFFNDTSPTELYTLSLHDALPISARRRDDDGDRHARRARARLPVHRELVRASRRDRRRDARAHGTSRSEEHTSELQSPSDLVCRLLLEKKKKSKQTDVCQQECRYG